MAKSKRAASSVGKPRGNGRSAKQVVEDIGPVNGERSGQEAWTRDDFRCGNSKVGRHAAAGRGISHSTPQSRPSLAMRLPHPLADNPPSRRIRQSVAARSPRPMHR